MNSPVKIRIYRPADRDAVRQLAYDTADAGQRSSFADPVLQMDLLTRYYTDHEPQSTWIAEQRGEVVGYLTGCLNTRRFATWMSTRGNAAIVIRMLLRNLFRPQLWRWVKARIRTVRAGGAHREPWITSHPAHFHLNLKPAARGQGVGAHLLDAFLTQCQNAGVPGVHLPTRHDNVAAQRFFRRHGFQPLAMVEAYRHNGTQLEPVSVLIMGKSVPAPTAS
jgi:ribosomal protein S18 acetylase RimI-like enzyme